MRALAARKVWTWGRLTQGSGDGDGRGKGKRPLRSPRGVTCCSPEAELSLGRAQHRGGSLPPLGTSSQGESVVPPCTSSPAVVTWIVSPSAPC